MVAMKGLWSGCPNEEMMVTWDERTAGWIQGGNDGCDYIRDCFVVGSKEEIMVVVKGLWSGCPNDG